MPHWRFWEKYIIKYKNYIIAGIEFACKVRDEDIKFCEFCAEAIKEIEKIENKESIKASQLTIGLLIYLMVRVNYKNIESSMYNVERRRMIIDFVTKKYIIGYIKEVLKKLTKK